MKRLITKQAYSFLKQELKYLETKEEITEEKTREMLEYYQVVEDVRTQTIKKPRFNVIQILLLIGALLIGLSILSFVASNWSKLDSVAKYLILLFTMVGFYVSARVFESKKPYLSRAFYFMGALTFGGNIFYIGQLFHLGVNTEDAFLLWGLGVLPLAYYLRDPILKLGSIALIYIFIEMKFILAHDWMAYLMVVIFPLMFFLAHRYVERFKTILLVANLFFLYQFIQIQFAFKPMAQEQYPFLFVLVLPLLFYVGHKYLDKSKPLFILNILMTIQLAIMSVVHFEIENIALVFFFIFAVGMYFYYFQLEDYQMEMKVLGGVMHFLSAFILTIPFTWDLGSLAYSGLLSETSASTAFAILYGLYGVYLIKKENLLGIGIVSVLIFRYYIDLSLHFSSKSLAFLIGGILLISLGIWFERSRRKGAR